jgi:6-phospho-beta-glucosidase
VEIRSLAVVGGASAYTPGLMLALLNHANDLQLEEICLYDIDAENLKIVEALLRQMVAASDQQWKITASTNLKEALTGVDAVLNSSRPGGLACRRIDETIPLEFDIPGQETVGPGGFFFALRSIPEAHRVADALLQNSPDALFINYTNPSNIVTQSLLDRRDINVIGICDQSDEDLHSLAVALGKQNEQLTFRCSGLNHATWYSDISFGTTPFTGLSLAEELPMPTQIDTEHELRFHCSEKLGRRYRGYWPNSYIPYYLEPSLFVEHSKAMGPRSAVIEKKIASYYSHFKEEAEKKLPVVSKHRGSAGFGDLAVSLLRAFNCNTPLRLVVNIRNVDMTPQFHADTVVEANLKVSSKGVKRETLPGIPSEEEPLLAKLENYQRLTASAALTGTRIAAIEALASNPLVESDAIAENLIVRAKQIYPTSYFSLK